MLWFTPTRSPRLLFVGLVMVCATAYGCNFSDSIGESSSPSGMMTSGDMASRPDLNRPVSDSGDDTPDSSQPPADMPLPTVDGCTPLDTISLCADRGVQCGPLTTTDNCGLLRDVECGACPSGEACEPSLGLCECVPEEDDVLCSTLGLQCGTSRTLDNCGQPRDLDCGECDQAGVLCEQNMCAGCAPESDEDFCVRLGKNCGVVSAQDNCGIQRDNVACGVCKLPETCSTQNTCVCEPESDEEMCGRLGKSCGPFTDEDNCGTTRDVDCGDCDSGTCLPDNTCEVCQPETDTALCARFNMNCADLQATDNCGTSRQVTCGTCSGGEVCMQPGRCVCPTPSCNDLECGTVSNRCGASTNCGSCSNGEQCVGNICECPTPTCAPDDCGTITNACGATRDCGGCTGLNDTCTNNTCVCQPETNQQLCQAWPAFCGNISTTDRCGQGRNVNCGSCPNGQYCLANEQCCPTGMICELW